MSINRPELKSYARQCLRETKPSPLWLTFLYLLLTLVLQFLLMSVTGELEALWEMTEKALAGVYEEILPETNAFGNLLSVLLQVMGMILAIGYSLVCLRISRRLAVSAGSLFDGFAVFLRALALSLLRDLIVVGWSMAYVLPAVFLTAAIGPLGLFITLPLLYFPLEAAYSYRLSVFLLLDYPPLASLQCLRLSRQIMKGYKWPLFVLDLSFLGWQLLTIIPFVSLWVLPYTETTNAVFYDRVLDLSGWRERLTPPAPPSGGEGRS